MIWVPPGIDTQHFALKDNLGRLFYYKYCSRVVIPLTLNIDIDIKHLSVKWSQICNAIL